MRVYLNAALCKKCPFSAFRLCHYKRFLYQRVPKTEPNLKMVHNCTYYRKIFKKGQYVLVNLYDQLPGKNGRWEYVPAHQNVPGVIKGTRGHKFVVALFEPYFLVRKKRGRPHTSRLKLYTECTRVAKDIRPYIFREQNTQILERLPEAKQIMN